MTTFKNTKTGEVLTEEQYKSKFGRPVFSSTPPPSEGNYITRTISEAFSEGVNQAKKGLEQGRNASNPLEAIESGITFGGGAISAAFSPLAPAIKPTVGKAVDFAADKISNSPAVQKFADSKAGRVTERIAENTVNLSTIAGTAAGLVKASQVASAAVRNTKVGLDATTRGVENIKTAISTTKKLTPDEAKAQAIRDATPDYESSTPTGKGKLLGRTEEGGFLKGRNVKSNALETEAGIELANMEGYNPSATKLAKYQAAEAEVAKRGQALEQSLKSEKIIVPKKEVGNRVKQAINEVPNKSLLLQKSDPVMSNYVRVLESAFRQVDGTLDGVLQLRKIMDDAYENARGKQAFGSDKISALDDIHTAARNSMTEYLIEKAVSTDVKASLRSQWNLYRAMDMLKIAAEKESGSVLGRKMQKYPMTTRVIKSVGNATGIGGAVNVLTP